MKLERESKISLLVVTACYVLLGLVLLFCPQFTVTMLCYAVGGISIVYGVSRVVAYALQREGWDEPYRFDLVVGLVFAGAGLYAILQSGVVAGFLNTVVGLAVCLDSLVKLQTAIDLQRLGSRVWVSVLVLAMVTGALGVVLFFYKGTGLLSALQFVGVSLVIDGCVNIWSFTFLAMNLARLRKARRAQAAAQSGPQADAPDAQDTAPNAPNAPDEEVRSGLLNAFVALKKKKAAPEAPAPAMDAPAKAAVLLLKPTDEELGAAHPSLDTHGDKAAPAADAQDTAAQQETDTPKA